MTGLIARAQARVQRMLAAIAAENAQRRVVITAGPHGMAELYAYLPADGAQALWRRIQADADSSKTLTDGRGHPKTRGATIWTSPTGRIYRKPRDGRPG